MWKIILCPPHLCRSYGGNRKPPSRHCKEIRPIVGTEQCSKMVLDHGCVWKDMWCDVSCSKTLEWPNLQEGEGEKEVVTDHGWKVGHKKWRIYWFCEGYDKHSGAFLGPKHGLHLSSAYVLITEGSYQLGKEDQVLCLFGPEWCTIHKWKVDWLHTVGIVGQEFPCQNDGYEMEVPLWCTLHGIWLYTDGRTRFWKRKLSWNLLN